MKDYKSRFFVVEILSILLGSLAELLFFFRHTSKIAHFKFVVLFLFALKQTMT